MERDHPTPKDVMLPERLQVNFASIPEKLQAYNQWVVWQYQQVEDEIKKPPFTPTTGKRASVTRPETWGSFTDAQRAYATGKFAGVGFVLTSGIVGIDIDHCIQDGQISEDASLIAAALNTYTEVSPSGTGLHLLLHGSLPGHYRRSGNIEMYQDGRYLTITGQSIHDTPLPLKSHQETLDAVYYHIFATPLPQRKENTGWGSGLRPPVAYLLSRSDEEVLHKALAAKNGTNFKKHYHGDTSLWEGAGAKHQSQSEADFTLVLMLLYWTNKDTTQVDRLFRKSGLMREKWDRVIKGSETYGERIIKDAIVKGNP